jgi:hypothetical protein
MTTTNRSQLFGIAGAIGGLLYFLMMWLGSEDTSDAVEPFMAVAALIPLLLGLGVAGLYQRTTPNGAGKVGLVLAGIAALSMTVGMGLMAWSDSDAGWSIWMFSILGHLLGLLIFAIGNWRERGRTRFNLVALLMSLIAVLGLSYSFLEEFVLKLPWSQQSEVSFLVFFGGLCLGWVVLGVLLALGSSAESTPNPQAA